MKIIPAIDLIDGACVRLAQGDYEAVSRYTESPLEMAKRFEDAGIRFLHLVDLDGARSGSPKNTAVLHEIASATTLTIDYSGGLRTHGDIRSVFQAGAHLVGIGSAAITDPTSVQEWITEFGAKRFILGADVRERCLAISGWTVDTKIHVREFVEQWEPAGVQAFLCTAIERDGLLQGPDFSLYSELQDTFPESEFIVSGGVTSEADLQALQEQGARSVIIGKALYEGRLSLEQIVRFQC
ncbi:1-(5-phosphoribosyl)-5-[(5-phosphoribosylamino)methylideneamino]imidazole-4-carboxamide isomerase [bacterium]|nr:1-(5-phosphoribosyl)-5-[(5-phosphoribosylamino)methylideneamino]imidazole-4-carboxamide isomerase [bacterium]